MRKSLLIFFVFAGIHLSAQDFRAIVSTDTVLIGNKLKLSFVIENQEGHFNATEFKDFDIFSGPNVASSISIVNGTKSSKKTYTYYLVPKSKGTLNIPPANLMTDSDLLETKEINIVVLPNPENIIIEPESSYENGMMEMRNFNFEFPFSNKSQKEKPPTTPEPKKKKRKLKKI